MPAANVMPTGAAANTNAIPGPLGTSPAVPAGTVEQFFQQQAILQQQQLSSALYRYAFIYRRYSKEEMKMIDEY